MTQELQPRVMRNGNNRYFPVTHSEYVVHDKEMRLTVHDVLLQVAPLSLTYAELVAMAIAGKLAQGQTYRITDYVTTTALAGTQSAGHQFDIIVVATTASTLSHHAWAVRHEGDTYFKDCKLEAWSLNYDIYNDTDEYAWADAEHGKGVIWWMRDEHGNEAPYDFKNIQFKRYRLKGRNYIHVCDSVMSDDEYKEPLGAAFNQWKEFLGTGIATDRLSYYLTRGTDEDSYPKSGADVKEDYFTEYDDNGWEPEDDKLYVSLSDISDHYEIIGEVEATGEWMYTFSRKETVAANAVDASLNSPNVHHNVIRQWRQNGVIQLNGSVFVAGGSSASFYANTTGFNNYYNTYGNGCSENTYGNNCHDNTYGNDVYAIAVPANSRYLHVLSGTQAEDYSDRLAITVEANCVVCQFVGLNSQGELKVWKPADLV